MLRRMSPSPFFLSVFPNIEKIAVFFGLRQRAGAFLALSSVAQ